MPYVYRVTPRPKRSVFRNFSITLNLIIINVIAFILFFILLSQNISYLDYFILKPFNIFQGKYLWTFLTSMFLHGGFFHLFVNMFSLFFVGSLVERLIGKKRFLWFYLIAGIFAGLLFVLIELLFPTNPEIGAVGASGALFGVVGLLVVLTPNLPVYVMLIPIPIKMKYAGPGLVILLWLISISPTFFGGESLLIGNTAHLGGLLVGLGYGFYLKKKYKRKSKLISRHFS